MSLPALEHINVNVFGSDYSIYRVPYEGLRTSFLVGRNVSRLIVLEPFERVPILTIGDFNLKGEVEVVLSTDRENVAGVATILVAHGGRTLRPSLVDVVFATFGIEGGTATLIQDGHWGGSINDWSGDPNFASIDQNFTTLGPAGFRFDQPVKSLRSAKFKTAIRRTSTSGDSPTGSVEVWISDEKNADVLDDGDSQSRPWVKVGETAVKTWEVGTFPEEIELDVNTIRRVLLEQTGNVLAFRVRFSPTITGSANWKLEIDDTATSGGGMGA